MNFSVGRFQPVDEVTNGTFRRRPPPRARGRPPPRPLLAVRREKRRRLKADVACETPRAKKQKEETAWIRTRVDRIRIYRHNQLNHGFVVTRDGWHIARGNDVQHTRLGDFCTYVAYKRTVASYY